MRVEVKVDREWLEKWKNYFTEYYDIGGVEKKVREAISFTKHYVEDSIVAVSGGKDSMTMLHIIYNNISHDIVVFHWDHGPWLMPRHIENEILENIRKVAPKAKLIVKRYAYGLSPRSRIDYVKWYKAFFKTLEEMGVKYHLLGIRAEESSNRRLRGSVVRKRKWIEVYPVYYFTWRDIWAYVFKHNVPVPRTYFKYARILGWSRARLTTFHDQEFMKYGSPNIDSIILWRNKHTAR